MSTRPTSPLLRARGHLGAGRCAGLATAAALLWLLLAPGMAAAAASWSAETSPTANALLDIACPDVDNCWSVGGTATASTIVHTVNGSTASPTWSTQTSPTGATDQYNGVACASSTACWAVGGLVSAKPLIGATTNGTAWTPQTPPAGATAALQSVSCPSTLICFAVGGVVTSHPEIIGTANGGGTWTAKTAPATTANQLNGISCPSTTVCFAAGGTAGTANIVTTINGGTTWSAQTAPSGATVALNDITCTDTSDCVAVGNAVSSNGEIVTTTNGGSTWTLRTDGNVNQALADVTCLTATACTAVGAGGTIVTTTTGTSWSAQTSGTANQLNAIDFNSAAFGKAVGASGTIRGFSGCGGSGLNFTPPSTLSWPSTALNGRDQTVGATLTLAPDDETGSGSGWNLTATSTTFKAGINALPTTAATITAGVATAGTNNCTLPTNSVTYPLTVPAATTAPTAVKVYNAAVAGGAGPTNVALTTDLGIPGNAKSGAYTSTWTITLASGP